PSAGRAGLAVGLGRVEGRPMVLTQARRYFRLTPRDVSEPPRPVAHIELPRSGSRRSARYRRDVAAALSGLNLRPPRPRREAAASPAESDDPDDAASEARARKLLRLAQAHP